MIQDTIFCLITSVCKGYYLGQNMFLVPTKLVMFIFHPYKIFYLFFILVKPKYVIFWPEVRYGKNRSYVLSDYLAKEQTHVFCFPHHYCLFFVYTKNLGIWLPTMLLLFAMERSGSYEGRDRASDGRWQTLSFVVGVKKCFYEC